MKRLPFLALSIALLCNTSYAQIDVPVDLLTGRPQVSIPLWNVSYAGLSVPVLVNYNGNGVRVEDEEGNAGMSWNLIAESYISREIRSLPDDYFGNSNDASDLRKGWLYGTIAQDISSRVFTADDNLSICSDETSDWNFVNGYAYNYDTEPDVFIINAPGLNGQFIFDASKTARFIPYQDLKIVVNPGTNEPITSFEITKNDGTKYTFDKLETTTRRSIVYEAGKVVTNLVAYHEQYKKSIKYTSKWFLTKMESPQGGIIKYRYTSRKGRSKKDVHVFKPDNTIDSLYYVQDDLTSYILDKISSPAQNIQFEWIGSDKIISRVSITDGITGTAKGFDFEYQYIRCSNDNRFNPATKAFLSSIKEYSASGCNSFPAYAFEYYGVTYPGGSTYGTTAIPFHDTKTKQDLFGYYNGTAASKIPTIYFYASVLAGAERYRLFPHPSLTPTTQLSGADRSVNPSVINTGALKKITYPSGGSALITYEATAYREPSTGTDRHGGGLRVAQVSIQDNIAGAPDQVKQYEYKMGDGTSSGRLRYPPTLAFHNVNTLYRVGNDLSPDNALMHERVSVIEPGKGKSIYYFNVPAVYPATTAAPDWQATKTKILRNGAAGCPSVGHMQNQYYSFPFSPNTNWDFEQGELIEIEDYDESGSPFTVNERIFTYQRRTTTTSITKGLRIDALSGMYLTGHYQILANVGKVLVTETQRYSDMNDWGKKFETSTTYAYDNVTQLLRLVSQTGSDGRTLKKTYRYAKDFDDITNPSGTYATGLHKLNADFRHGALVETIESVVHGVETTTGASLTLYDIYPDSLGEPRALPAEQRVFNGTTNFQQSYVYNTNGLHELRFGNTYRPAVYFEAYDDVGNLLSLRTSSRNRQAFVYGYRKSLPIASFSNAKADEIVYSGFETYNNCSFTFNPAYRSGSGAWSGKYAYTLSASSYLERNNIKKAPVENYRYSFRATSSSGSQVIIKVLNGQSVVVSSTIDCTSGWKFYEGTILMNSVPATFNLKIERIGSNVTVDDIAFYPEGSEAILSTYEPLYGKTSQTNSRGVTTFWEYDNLGREKYTRDTDKNVRQITDYYYKVQQSAPLNAGFFADRSSGQIVAGVGVTFTAVSNCEPVTHEWFVNGISRGTFSSLWYNFGSAQKYIVKHVVTHALFGSTFSQIEYDVKDLSGTGPITVDLSPDQISDSYCGVGTNGLASFTATLAGCYQTPSIAWYYQTGWMNEFVPVPGTTGASFSPDGKTLTLDVITICGGLNNLTWIKVKCVVSGQCPLTLDNTSATAESIFNYTGDDRPCH